MLPGFKGNYSTTLKLVSLSSTTSQSTSKPAQEKYPRRISPHRMGDNTAESCALVLVDGSWVRMVFSWSMMVKLIRLFLSLLCSAL